MKKRKKKRFVLKKVYKLILFFICVSLLIMTNVRIVKKMYNKYPEPAEEINPPKSSLNLVMVGDALIHEAVYNDAKKDYGYDFKPMLEEMKPIISSFDLEYYNQETILGGTELGLSTYPRFNSPYEVGDAFLDAGFNVVSLANNHTLDRGEQAIQNSCNYWKDKKVALAGSYCSNEDRNEVKIYEKNGIKYTILSYTTTTNGIRVPEGKEYLVNVYSPEKVKADVEKYKGKVDLIMVAMHWGQEYTHSPVSEQKEIANYLASLGVNIVIGAHPHVVEPIEFIDKTLVIYSLGNFLSSQRGIEKLTGLMASCTITKDPITEEITIDNVEAELLYTYTDTYKGYRSNYKVYPYTKLNDSILNNHESYYNKFMNYVIGDKDYIKKGDYSGNSK